MKQRGALLIISMPFQIWMHRSIESLLTSVTPLQDFCLGHCLPATVRDATLIFLCVYFVMLWILHWAKVQRCCPKSPNFSTGCFHQRCPRSQVLQYSKAKSQSKIWMRQVKHNQCFPYLISTIATMLWRIKQWFLNVHCGNFLPFPHCCCFITLSIHADWQLPFIPMPNLGPCSTSSLADSLSMSSCSKLRCCTHATTENKKHIYIYIHYYIYTHQSTNPVLHSYHAKPW